MRKLGFSLFVLGLMICRSGYAESVKSVFAKLPLSFEANQGQAGARVQYLSRGPGYTMYLSPGEVVIAGNASTKTLRMKLAGANPHARLEALDPLPGITNYFIGTDPAKWRTRIPNYSRVAMRDVYPGIDLIFYGNQRELEYDAVIQPGADPKRIRVKFEGAGKMHREAGGDLVVSLGGAEIRQRKPVILQDSQQIDGGYVIHGKEVAFNVPKYDPSRPLIIDPAYVYSSYLGGTDPGSALGGTGIAVDTSGNTYVTGYTFSTGLPLVNAEQPTFGGGGSDAFVVKINPQGSAIIYSTYLGGNSLDKGAAIAADAAGNAYVTGYSEGGFPGTGGSQSNFAGGSDAFVAKLDPQGANLLFASYIGGPGGDQGTGIALDSAANIYVTGLAAAGLPLVHPAQATYGGGASDAFVAKIGAQGGITYLTYIGGKGTDAAAGIAVDGAANAYIVGTTDGQFPVVNALQSTFGGIHDAFVTKLDPAGNLLFSTYLGGPGEDSGAGVAVDLGSNIYVTGSTAGSFPVTAPFQANYGGGASDAFVTKINAAGTAVVYSTYLGGPNIDAAAGIAVDAAGSALVTGYTQGGFPVTDNSAFGGATDAFVTLFTPQGNSLIFSSNLGGKATDIGSAIAVDVNGAAYVTGTTFSKDFPTSSVAFQNNPNSSSTSEAFVTVITRSTNAAATLGLTCTHGGVLSQGEQNALLTLTVNNKAGAPATNGTVTVTDTLPTGFTLVSASGTGWTCNNASCSRSDSLAGNTTYPAITLVVNVASNAPQTVTNQVTAFGGGSTAAFCSDFAVIGAPNTSGTAFGSFDTPTNNTSSVTGAIAITGWALDTQGVSRVEIWRDAVPSDPQPNSGQIFIGNATFVFGARPDVQASFPSYPNANRAGWGYMLLTNFLPNNGGSTGPGNGNFRLHAYAYNLQNNVTELGAPGKNIACDNAHAVKPFGTIDTPGQGDTVQGTQYVNFGWALTPGANFIIPNDGSTITVNVDSVSLGNPVYNQYRSDIATAFQGYNNSGGAVGYKIINTTGLANGVHTIGWTVYDNLGRGDGIGSRFFTVSNAGTNVPDTAAASEPIEQVSAVTVRRGYDLGAKAETLGRSHLNGACNVDVEELGRIELHVGAASGSQRVGGVEQALPVGSSLRGGVFYWQVAAGFLGEYDLMFVRPDGEQVAVRVRVRAKTFASSVQ